MISIGKCKAFSRRNLLGNYTLVIGARILAFIIPIALFCLSAVSLGAALYGGNIIGSIGTANPIIVIVGALLFAAFLMLAVITGIFCGYGVTKLYIHICRGEDYGLSDIFYPFSSGAHPWRVVGVKLIMWILLAVASLLIFILSRPAAVLRTGPAAGTVSTVCTVASAVVVLIYVYILVTFYLADLIVIDKPGTGVFEAFDRSAQLMKGHKLKGFWFIFFSFIFWNILTSVCGIASLWVAPYIACTRIFFYMSAEGTLPDVSEPAAYEVDGTYTESESSRHASVDEPGTASVSPAEDSPAALSVLPAITGTAVPDQTDAAGYDQAQDMSASVPVIDDALPEPLYDDAPAGADMPEEDGDKEAPQDDIPAEDEEK